MSGAAQRKPRRQSLEPGMTIAGRYVVQSIIGQGGMGQVLEVEHISLGRRFALKVLRLERWNDELVRRFNREARALAKLTTPRVAQVTDFGIDEESGPYYVMELLAGETLEQRLERLKRLSPREALTLGAATCDALADCHAAGIVHRDLKPSNVGLCDGGPVAVKLLDFGLAASMDEAFLSKITQSQQILGSLPYMAPEQFNGAAAAPSMDIYAVGICLYEALSGRLPFMAPSTAALIHQILSTPVPALPPELAGMGPLSELLERLLAKEPERRFASIAAAGEAMRGVLRALGGEAGSAGPHPLTRANSEPMPPTVQARAVDSDRVGMMPTLMAESGTRLSSAGHDPALPPTVEEPAPPAPVAWQSAVVPPTPAAGTRPFAGSSVGHASAVGYASHVGPPAHGSEYPPLAPPTNVHGHAALPGPAASPIASPWGFRLAVAALLGLIAAGLLTIVVIVAINVTGTDEADVPPAPAAQVAEPAPPIAPPIAPPSAPPSAQATDLGAADSQGAEAAGDDSSMETVQPRQVGAPDDVPQPRRRGRSAATDRPEPRPEPLPAPQPRPLGAQTQPTSPPTQPTPPPTWRGDRPINSFE